MIELADKIIALGVGHKNGSFYGLGLPLDLAPVFVHDWRVAGALLELCVGKPDWMLIQVDRKVSSTVTHRCWIERTHSGTETENWHARDESLPLAIIKACVEVLSL